MILLAVELFAVAGTAVAMLIGRYTGVLERLHVAGGSLWLLLVALAVVHRDPPGPDRS
jgi:hypothetical protein